MIGTTLAHSNEKKGGKTRKKSPIDTKKGEVERGEPGKPSASNGKKQVGRPMMGRRD